MLQRCGWLALAVLIAAAALGVFGGGPVSRVTLGSEGEPLRLEYERLWRMKAPTRLHLHVAGAPGGEVQVWVSRSYLEAVDVAQILPPPQRVAAGAERFTFLFRLHEGEAAIPIVFAVEPDRPGLIDGEVGLEQGPSIRFRQFIYP